MNIKLFILLGSIFTINGCDQKNHGTMEYNSCIYYYNLETYHSTSDLIKIECEHRSYIRDNLISSEFDGIWNVYYSSGKMKENHEFINGIGYLKQYNENGILQNEGRYTNGKKDGIWKAYHSNSQLESITSYINGKKNGEFILYYNTGEIKSQGFFKNNKKDGVWKTYSTQGNLDFAIRYINGHGTSVSD